MRMMLAAIIAGASTQKEVDKVLLGGLCHMATYRAQRKTSDRRPDRCGLALPASSRTRHKPAVPERQPAECESDLDTGRLRRSDR